MSKRLRSFRSLKNAGLTSDSSVRVSTRDTYRSFSTPSSPPTNTRRAEQLERQRVDQGAIRCLADISAQVILGAVIEAAVEEEAELEFVYFELKLGAIGVLVLAFGIPHLVWFKLTVNFILDISI